MNNTMIAGHLAADPEVRHTPDGQKVTNFRVASNIRKKGKDVTMWWNVTIWGDRFDRLVPYLKKGSAAMVWGTMGEPRIYNDKSGNPQVALDLTAEIIQLSPFGRSDKQEQGQGAAPGQPNPNYQPQAHYGAPQQQHAPAFPEGDFSYNPGASSSYDTFSSPFGKGPSSGKSFDDDNVPF